MLMRLKALHNGSAFTMLELLAVVSVVLLLSAIIIPTIGRAKFRGKVAACSSNLKQIILASTMYAGEDSKSRLPSHALPVASSTLSFYKTLEPWFVPIPMITNLARFGAKPEFWYCPTKHTWKRMNDYFRSVNQNSSIQNEIDIAQFFQQAKSPIASLDMSWWVPRPFDLDPNIFYPDPQRSRTSDQTPWPTRSDEPPTKPIVTDTVVSAWDKGSQKAHSFGQGHSYNSKLVNANLAYIDGRVETKLPSQIQWRILAASEDHAVAY